MMSVLSERPHDFRRHVAVRPIFREMGIDGLFSAEGEDWRRRRPLVMRPPDSVDLRADLTPQAAKRPSVCNTPALSRSTSASPMPAHSPASALRFTRCVTRSAVPGPETASAHSRAVIVCTTSVPRRLGGLVRLVPPRATEALRAHGSPFARSSARRSRLVGRPSMAWAGSQNSRRRSRSASRATRLSAVSS